MEDGRRAGGEERGRANERVPGAFDIRQNNTVTVSTARGSATLARAWPTIASDFTIILGSPHSLLAPCRCTQCLWRLRLRISENARYLRGSNTNLPKGSASNQHCDEGHVRLSLLSLRVCVRASVSE